MVCAWGALCDLDWCYQDELSLGSALSRCDIFWQLVLRVLTGGFMTASSERFLWCVVALRKGLVLVP